MTRTLTLWLPLLVVGIVLSAGLSIWLEARQAGRAATRYLGIWETEIARSYLMNEHKEEAQKLIAQIEEFHPSLSVAKEGQTQCSWPVRRSVSLFSLPAVDVEVCRDPGIVTGQALISPVFLGLLFVISALVALAIRREYQEKILRLAAESKAEAEASLGRLSRQVAHDIRGPLSALQALSTHAKGMQAEERDLLHQASKRIHDIAEDLLKNSRSQDLQPRLQINELKTVGLCRVDDVLETLKLELLLRYPRNPIQCSLQANETVALPAAIVQRIISNLVQNAVEASKPDQIILIATRKQGGVVTLTVSDEGRGIPAEIIQKLGTQELSHGKVGGNGLGILDARQTLDHAGGRLTIRSREGVGTQVELVLPLVATAQDSSAGNGEAYSSTTKPSSSSSVF